MLVTEAGDFSLEELIKCRQKPAYKPDEVLLFLKQIAPAYLALKKLKIYHSDTKVGNIIYSREKKSFIVIDFGVANVVSEDIEEMQYYVRGGTEGFNSPEKKKYLIHALQRFPKISFH